MTNITDMTGLLPVLRLLLQRGLGIGEQQRDLLANASDWISDAFSTDTEHGFGKNVEIQRQQSNPSERCP